jgi:hypothetical protein
MKKAFIVMSVVAVFVGGAAAYLFLHDTGTLSYEATTNFKVSETNDLGTPVVHISGFAFHGALTVKEVTVEPEGLSLVVLVHLKLVGKGHNPFDCDVRVPDWANEIRYGKERKIVWQRQAPKTDTAIVPPLKVH